MKEREKTFAAVLSLFGVGSLSGGWPAPASGAVTDQTTALKTRMCQADPENSIKLRNRQEEEKYRRAEQEDRNIQQQMETKGLKSQATNKLRKSGLHIRATLSESQTRIEKMQREKNVQEQTGEQTAFFHQHRARECEERMLP